MMTTVCLLGILKTNAVAFSETEFLGLSPILDRRLWARLCKGWAVPHYFYSAITTGLGV